MTTVPDDEEKPPFFSSWRRLYAAILTFLVFLIASFYWFTRTFNR